VIARLRETPAFVARRVPIIYFANGCAPYLDDYAGSGADVLGVDFRITIGEVARRVGPSVALQGNLDPGALFASPAVIRERVRAILADAPPVGHIFNLGHGVMPTTNPEHVRAMVAAVREFGRRSLIVRDPVGDRRRRRRAGGGAAPRPGRYRRDRARGRRRRPAA
jgi:uroporphyrinogen-III decarboxylase